MPGYAPVLDIPIRSNLLANVILISESLNALLLISSFLFSVKSVRCSLSLSLAHSGSLDSYATQCVRMCDWIWWTFGPLLWIFFFRETALCFGVELIKKREKWNGNAYEGDKIKISTKFYKVMLLNFSLTLEFFFFTLFMLDHCLFTFFLYPPSPSLCFWLVESSWMSESDLQVR